MRRNWKPFIRFEARSRILEQWDQEEPNLFLPEQVRTYIRIHTALANPPRARR